MIYKIFLKPNIKIIDIIDFIVAFKKESSGIKGIMANDSLEFLRVL